MALINELFPVVISYNSEGGPNYRVTIDEMDNGKEQRLARWPVGRHSYDAKGGVKTKTQYADVLDLFHVAGGPEDYFRWKDYGDFQTAATVTHTDCELVDANGAPAVGDGSTTVFYLAKKYTFGGTSKYRPITLPVAETVKIGVGGSLQTVTTHYTLDDTTGAVTFVSAPALSAVLTGGCEFHVPVRFDTEYLPGRIINRSGNEFLIDFDIPLIEVFR